VIDLEKLARVMTDAGVDGSTRKTLAWLAQHINEQFEWAVERAVERELEPRDPMED